MTGTNKAISQLDDAATLTGDELIVLVQDGNSMKTAVSNISPNNLTSIHIGKGSESSTVAVGIGNYATASAFTSVAIGHVAKATASATTAVGRRAYAYSNGGTAIGAYTRAIGGHNGTAVGYGARSYQLCGVALGAHSKAKDPYGVALGSYATTHGDYAIAIGKDAYANGDVAISIGANSLATNDTAIAIGVSTQATDSYGLAVGVSAIAGSNDIAIGYNATASSNGSVAIGFGARAINQFTIAIGYETYAPYNGSLVFGKQASTTGNYGIAIGYRTEAGNHALALGSYSSASKYGITIGATSTSAKYGIAIGFQTVVSDASGIAIGRHTVADNEAVVLGFNAIASGISGIAIGTYATSTQPFSVSVGHLSSAYHSSLALGVYASGDHGGAAIGYSANANGVQSIAIGTNAYAGGDHAVAIGPGASASGDHSVVLGSTDDMVSGSFTFRGNSTVTLTTPLYPTIRKQMVFGRTDPGLSATAHFAETDVSFFIVNESPGLAGNTMVLQIHDVTGIANEPLSITMPDSNTLRIFLATDSDGNNSTTNGTLGAGLDDFGSFTHGYNSGDLNTILHCSTSPGTDVFDFAGGTDSITDVVLTSDNTEPVEGNVPAMMTASVARMTGTVMAYGSNMPSDGNGDSASFILQPLLMTKKTDQTYVSNVEPTFVLEAASGGAEEWTPPQLTTSEDGTLLFVVAPGQNITLNWVAFLTFEATQ